MAVRLLKKACMVATLAFLIILAPLAALGAVPLQKILEAGSGHVRARDFAQLEALLPYLTPTLAEYQAAHATDLRGDFTRAIGQRSSTEIGRLLAKIALFDLLRQLDLPQDQDRSADQERIGLAYLDYHYAVSPLVQSIEFKQDTLIRGWFHNAHRAPRSTYLALIVKRLSVLVPDY